MKNSGIPEKRTKCKLPELGIFGIAITVANFKGVNFRPIHAGGPYPATI